MSVTGISFAERKVRVFFALARGVKPQRKTLSALGHAGSAREKILGEFVANYERRILR